jgi:CMP-N-acetylneuraminic acid synthetase
VALEGLSVLAVVPARGGSKSIPRKNLCAVGGVSLVALAARAVRSVEWLDARILSTDNPEIAAEGERHGLDVPFLRPAELSGDTASSAGVWRHAWLAAEERYQRTFDISVLAEPTSPLRTPEDIERTVRQLIRSKAGCAATVSPTPAHFTPQKTLTVAANGDIGFYLEGGSRFSLRQSIPRYYHRNGLCYAVTRRHLVDEGMILERNAVAVIVDRPVVNIDEPFELEVAEWLISKGQQT